MLLERLLQGGALDPDVLSSCMSRAETENISLEQALFEAGHIEEQQFLAICGERYGMPCEPELDVSVWNEGNRWQVDAELMRRLSFAWLKKRQVVPLRDAEGNMLIAAARPSGWRHAQEFGVLTGERPRFCILAPEAAVARIINRLFGEGAEDDGDSVAHTLDGAEIIEVEDDGVEDLLEDVSDLPFIKTVNLILAQALRAGASDIHIEPFRDISRVRFRLDGVLYERHTINKAHHAAVVSRIKVMAKLNIAEKRLPQDGRIAIVLGGRQAGLRVSTLPTSFGERVVLRVLEKNERILSLGELGLADADFSLVTRLISSMHGIVLVTGPTGSGKTTTLYAVLQQIASPDKNILTIEDPVEYELDGIGQMQVNSRINLTFADGLRALVRQDPDVILIGEIRDGETASIAVQSALTGHLVFSTLHTNDAPSAVIRLIDMGVEPFLLSSVLRGVIAQRLIRVLCPACKTADSLTTAEMEKFRANGFAVDRHTTVYRPTGCPACMNTGYRGRIAMYEVMQVSDVVKRLVVERVDAVAIRAQAEKEGMRSLLHDGLGKVLAGMSSIEEVERIVRI